MDAMKNFAFFFFAVSITSLSSDSQLSASGLTNNRVANLQVGAAEPQYYKLPSEVELSDAEIQQMKHLVWKAVKQFNKSRRFGHISSLKNYGIQYRVSLNSKGEKEVWINSFCKEYIRSDDLSLNVNVVAAFDGGSCFFNTILNLKKNIPSGVSIHGDA